MSAHLRAGAVSRTEDASGAAGGCFPLIIEHRRGRGVGTVRLYCIRISDRLLIIGNGGIKKVVQFEDDPVLLGIVNQLRDIEHQIFVETRNAHSDYEDYQTIKTIIETITI